MIIPAWYGEGVAVARKVPASELKVPISRSNIWESRHDKLYNSTPTVSRYSHIGGSDNNAMEKTVAGKTEKLSDKTVSDRILCLHQFIDLCRETGRIGGIDDSAMEKHMPGRA